MYKVDFRQTYQCCEETLDVLIKQGKRSFVLYPFGEIGKFVKDYLKEKHGIEIKYAIDNKKYNGKDIVNMEQAKRLEHDDVCFIICSDNEEYYTEIRKTIYDSIENDKIYDLFPNLGEKRVGGGIFENEEIEAVLKQLDSYLESREKGCL